jgi:hypothetical protein
MHDLREDKGSVGEDLSLISVIVTITRIRGCAVYFSNVSDILATGDSIRRPSTPLRVAQSEDSEDVGGKERAIERACAAPIAKSGLVEVLDDCELELRSQPAQGIWK